MGVSGLAGVSGLVKVSRLVRVSGLAGVSGLVGLSGLRRSRGGGWDDGLFLIIFSSGSDYQFGARARN